MPPPKQKSIIVTGLSSAIVDKVRNYHLKKNENKANFLEKKDIICLVLYRLEMYPESWNDP